MTPEANDRSARIIGLFPELLGVGGVQEASRLTAAAIIASAKECHWSVDFLSLNDSPGPHTLGVGGQTIAFRSFGRAKIRFVSAAFRAVRSVPRESPTVLLATHPNLALPAFFVRRNSPSFRTVVMSHGIEVWQPLPFVRRRALTRANAVLGPSSDTTERLINVQGISKEKVYKLAWPISPAFLRLANSPTRLIAPTDFPAGPVVLTVGRWVAAERYKGLDDLIRAIAQIRAEIPNVNLVAVGSGDDVPRLRNVAADSRVAEHVHFLENLSREELAACYSQADIFALPSSGEGFGLVFLEAMAFSKPVIAAASAGAKDVVEDEVNGLMVPAGDSEKLARALRRLLCDASLRERLGRQGAAIVREKYRFDVFQRELAAIVNAKPRSQDKFLAADSTA
jgi:glycosyltransferase involved in cell wall biosynthesis